MPLSAKDPAERIPLGFDFSKLGSTLGSVSLAVAVLHGTDEAAADILDGTVSVTGTVATQWIVGGVLDTDYEIRCTGTTDNGIYVVPAVLQVRRAAPVE